MPSDDTNTTVIEDDNLSRAWARTFLHVLDHPGKTIAPLLVSLTGFSDDGGPIEFPDRWRTSHDDQICSLQPAGNRIQVCKAGWNSSEGSVLFLPDLQIAQIGIQVGLKGKC